MDRARARRTDQRRAIQSALDGAGRPLSPREILEDARRHVPRLGIATVYRNIRGMMDQGHLRAVDLPGAASRYELSGKAHHHHFHCRSCDRVYEIEECPGSLRKLAPRGFRVESHEIVLYGVCRGCARSR